MSNYEQQLEDIIESTRVKISDIKPSVWAEENIIMQGTFPGPLRYEKTPYTREIIDCFARDNPAREIAVMGAAQWGKTTSIIIPVIGYIIENDPGNIIMTVGHESLLDDAMEKIDAMLDSTGLRKLIKSSALRVKSQKTGDTNDRKEFPLGFLKLSAASNYKVWQQSSYKYGLIDDYERVKGKSKEAGNTRDLIGKRFTSYAETKKILYCSSPELENDSNILEVYLLGDQRKFKIPCPCCGTFIELHWSVPKVDDDKEICGITWQVDSDNRLIRESVGYKCQECGDFFTDQNKNEWVNQGFWEPTAKPFKPEFVSFHLNSLYSPHGMSDWTHYVYQFMEANPIGEPRNESKYQSFLNLDMGLPYKKTGEAPKANQLQKNQRDYLIGTVPEKMSIADGNGKIILLTCACDLNGTIDDARLDYEVLAWSENGSTYSVTHGSIGTFIPNQSQAQKDKVDRAKMTYEYGKSNNVWNEFDKIIEHTYQVDTGRIQKVLITGVDTGQTYNNQAYGYIDRKNNPLIVALKGKDLSTYVKYGADKRIFDYGKERKNLYLVSVGIVKDMLSERMKLKWDENKDTEQPNGFMNFPNSENNKYGFKNFFSHYESEHRTVETKEGEPSSYMWLKKSPTAQNHLWDIAVYGIALREIVVAIFGKEFKVTNFTWADFVSFALKNK